MAEYIEREAALTEFQKACDICMALVKRPMCGDCSVADTVRKVKRIPAADVRPVVRGEWERVGNTDHFRCTCCNDMILSAWDTPPTLINFCPNCGADLRKEAENGQTDKT